VCSDGLRVARSIKKSANQFGAATVPASDPVGRYVSAAGAETRSAAARNPLYGMISHFGNTHAEPPGDANTID
jgi:hypothetical protein